MNLHNSTRCLAEQAFSRIELMAVCAGIAMIAAIGFPVLAGTPGSERAVCANNLRLIGRALQSWAGNHEGYTPWRTPVREGGTRPDAGTKSGAGWYEYAFLSNDLVTPKILACPSDVGVRPASSFGQFVQTGFRANSLSYVAGLDAVAEAPLHWVSGDRNLSSSGPVGCSATRVSAADSILGTPEAGWTNGAVHGAFGHLLRNDGSTPFISAAQFRSLLFSAQLEDNGSGHYLRAR